MRVHYEDDFLEAAVFACASGNRPGIPWQAASRFHFQRERLYRIFDPDEREAAFFRLHATWFREWGLEKFLGDVTDEFQALARALDTLAYRKARSRLDEGAELYVNAAGSRQGVVAFRPDRFADEPGLACFLRHELMHVCDMVDPAFGYSPELRAPGANEVQQRLARDRYRVLWDLAIDGRLMRNGYAIGTPREKHWDLFSQAFSFWPEERRRGVFDELWMESDPDHGALTGLAGDPRGLDHTPDPTPGSACPLCGLPTFDWVDASAIEAGLVEAIHHEFPRWAPTHGVCRRCLEAYEVIEQQNLNSAAILMA